MRVRRNDVEDPCRAEDKGNFSKGIIVSSSFNQRRRSIHTLEEIAAEKGEVAFLTTVVFVTKYQRF